MEALSLLPRQYHLNWNHFGDGVCMGGVQKLAHEKLDNHDNVSYVLWGNKPNREILDWYGEKQVNCFINVSSTEGLPVSAQEALGFGVPLILSDVGGNKELIRDNGILLSPDPAPQEICDALIELIDMKQERYCELRENAMNLWKEQYNAQKNAKKFTDNLKTLLQ